MSVCDAPPIAGTAGAGAEAPSRSEMALPLDPAAFVRPELRALPVYHLDLSPIPHKLDQNEVPYDLPQRLKRQVVTALLARNWARYPDFHSDHLRAALGSLHGWPAAGVLVGNGSNELLGVVLEAILGRQDSAGTTAPKVLSGLTPKVLSTSTPKVLSTLAPKVLSTLPSFGLYPMFIRRAGGEPDFVSAGPDLALPMDALLAEVERDPTRPLLLCSPCNPTGAVASVAAVAALLERLRAPLLLDNAYGEFADEDYRPLLARYRHLVLFRTFSKAWSLAGMRIGYLLADPALVGELLKVKLPYNLNLASALAADAALEAADVAARRVRLIRRRRDQLVDLLSAAGLEAFPSAANFVLVRCRVAGAEPGLAGDMARQQAARRLFGDLRQGGVLVRDVSHYPGLAGCLRVSVGNGRSQRVLREVLTRVLPAGTRVEERGER